MAANIEDFMKTLGDPGKAQCGLSLLVNLNLMASFMHHLSMIFIGTTPPHHCKVSDELPLNVMVPFMGDKPSQCHMYLDPTNHSRGTTECTNGWTYLYQKGEWTIVGEFDLVCSSHYLVNLASTLYFFGTMVGAIVFGHLADRVGRKPVYIITVCIHSLVGIFQYFAYSYTMFVVFKFLHGMMIQGLTSSCLCLSMELFHTKWRTEASVFSGVITATGELLLVFLAYFNPNWRYFYLASTLPSLATVAYIWIVPESLRWLLVNNKTTEAVEVCKLYANINKIQLKPDLAEKIASYSEANTAKKHYDIRDLFSTAALRRKTLIVVFLWFTMSFVLLGVCFSFPSLDGDKYTNYTYGVVLSYIGRGAAYPGLKRLGRRITTTSFLLFGGLTYIGAAVINTCLQGTVAKSIATWLIILTKAAYSSNFMLITLQTQEVFPTVLRSSVIGLGGLFGQFSSLLAPQMELLGVYTYPIVPFLVIGLVSLLAAFADLFIPETYESPLSDSMVDNEQVNLRQTLTTKEKHEDNRGFVMPITEQLKLNDDSCEETMFLNREPGTAFSEYTKDYGIPNYAAIGPIDLRRPDN